MRFSIITPSYRNSNWLKLCVASVADQIEVEHEHIVQDAGSDDGTLDWLVADPRVRAHVEKDKGMYDAVNRGFRRALNQKPEVSSQKSDLTLPTSDLRPPASDHVLAYINCDEQYLPGALKKVSDFFNRHRDVDVVFGDCIVVHADGRYLCERRALTPQLLHTWVSGNLSFLTAATFLRRRVIEDHKLFFNPDLRDIGDGEWTLRLVKSGLRTAVLPEFLTAFTETGQNMNLGANAAREKREFIGAAPYWAQLSAPLILAYHRFRRWRAGHYACKPHDYAIYTMDSPAARKNFQVLNPTFRWIRPLAKAESRK
ncbi:MAG: glycosyltransferase [Verrucomicrobia bacterium]|nr:glycosyltransferase [Verrucomicrobiota bacterium]